MLSTHGLTAAAGFLAGAALMARRAQQPELALTVAAVVAVSALGGARLLFHVLHGPGSGLASMGGIAAGLGAAWALARLTRRPLSALLEPLAPPARPRPPQG